MKTASIKGGNADLVYSQDDEDSEGRGWYWHAYFDDGSDRVSLMSYRSKDDAIAAMREKRVDFGR